MGIALYLAYDIIDDGSHLVRRWEQTSEGR
jgi:hypothetical protein